VLERRLLRSPGITLRDRGNRDDAVSRARRSPFAVKHDAEERLLVAAAEERAVQALRSWDTASVCRSRADWRASRQAPRRRPTPWRRS